MKTKTKTSTYGSPGRQSHDSTEYYKRRMNQKGLTHRDQEIKFEENRVPDYMLDQLICASSEHMEKIPDNSVHLMVTSPPYNVGKDYDEDYSLDEYLDFLYNVWKETYRVLVPGGRACINLANLGRKPYIPLHSYVIRDMTKIGFHMRGEVIWDKAASSGSSCAWGSWKSAKNPSLRDIHEYILIFSKSDYSRPPGKSTITSEEFVEYTKSIWRFKTASAKRIGHPAPYPVELPSRCIKLYTYQDDIVLDPFVGSGTTAIAAIENHRHYIGYDNDSNYIKSALDRIREYKEGKV